MSKYEEKEKIRSEVDQVVDEIIEEQTKDKSIAAKMGRRRVMVKAVYGKNKHILYVHALK